MAIFMVIGTLTGNPTLSFLLAVFVPIGFVLKAILTSDNPEGGIVSADIIALILSIIFLVGLLL